MSSAGGLPPRAGSRQGTPAARPMLFATGSNGGVPFLQLPGLRVSSSGGRPALLGGLALSASGSNGGGAVRPGLRASSSGGRPLMLGGIALALSRSSSAAGGRSSSELDRISHLPDGTVIDEEGINGRSVYIIRDATTGEPVGVRKIASAATAGRAYDAAREEARIYGEIKAAAPDDWADHILPHRNTISKRQTIIMDFDWVPGSDLLHWINAGATHKDILSALDHAARKLRWLALAGWTHGDIKADNFYITTDGHVLLFDFDRARRRTPASALKDRGDFRAMITPYASAKTMERLDTLPTMYSLPDFYVLAARLLRREARPPRFRTRRHRRSAKRSSTRRH